MWGLRLVVCWLLSLLHTLSNVDIILAVSPATFGSGFLQYPREVGAQLISATSAWEWQLGPLVGKTVPCQNPTTWSVPGTKGLEFPPERPCPCLLTVAWPCSPGTSTLSLAMSLTLCMQLGLMVFTVFLQW